MPRVLDSAPVFEIFTFDFDLVFALPDGNHDPIELSEAVLQSGCPDAVISTGAPGRLAVSLEVEDHDAEATILEAAKAILRKLPEGTRLHEVGPDHVSLAEVADKLGVQRQALAQRRMPHPVAGGLYRITEIRKALEEIMNSGGRKPRFDMAGAEGWLRAGEGAAKVNARIALGEVVER